MNAFLKLLAGLAAVALIGAAALLFEGAPGSAGSAQEKLAARAADILEEQEADWASVRIDGQKAILSGEAPTQEARETLITAVAAAEGRGGLFSGGVTAVDASGLAAAPPEPVADPYIFIAERENGTLALSGYVPDQATRDAMLQQLNAERARRAQVTEAEGRKRAVGLAADAQLYAAEQQAKARRISAEAEAYATQVVAAAIAENGLEAAQYQVALKQVEALVALGQGAGKQTVVLPASALDVFADAFSLLKGRA